MKRGWVVVVLLTGCKLQALPAVAPPAVVVAQQLPGLASLRLTLAEPGGGTLPEFAGLYLTAFSPSTMDLPATLSLSRAAWQARLDQRTPLLQYLPERPDLAVRVYLTAADQTLLASGELVGTRLARGDNEVPLQLVDRTQLTPAALTSAQGTYVADGVILKGLDIAFATGLPPVMPGVTHLEVGIAGMAYGNGQESGLIGSFNGPDLSTFAWRPADAGAAYNPDKLGVGGGLQAFGLTLTAFDPFDHAVGVTRLPLHVVEPAAVNVSIGKPR